MPVWSRIATVNAPSGNSCANTAAVTTRPADSVALKPAPIATPSKNEWTRMPTSASVPIGWRCVSPRPQAWNFTT